MRHRVSVGVGCWAAVAALVPSLPASASALAAARSDIATPKTATTTLHVRSRGAGVRALQSTLARLSYLPNGAVDGVFGMQTWHAVVAFQSWSALARDGIVGRQTRGALARARRPTRGRRRLALRSTSPSRCCCWSATGGPSARFMSQPERAERRDWVTSGSTGVRP